MVALHYLKCQHDLSDEDVVAHWMENPTGSTSAASATFSIARRRGTQHRTSQGGTPAGTQPLEGRCRRSAQCHPERRGDELPQAPGSFLAHSSALPDAHLGIDSGPATVEHSANAFRTCLNRLFQDRLDITAVPGLHLYRKRPIAIPVLQRRQRLHLRREQPGILGNPHHRKHLGKVR